MPKPKTYFEQVPLVFVKGETLTMDEEELKFPEWQKPLQNAILEFNRERLLERVQKVKTLIVERQQQLARSSDGHLEREALDDGLSLIRVLVERR